MTQLDLVARLHATEPDPGVFVVSAEGPLDARFASELRDTLIPLAGADGAVVILDVIDAHGIDRATLAVVSDAAHHMTRRGGRLQVVSRSAILHELIEECGLIDIVDLVPSLAEAMRR